MATTTETYGISATLDGYTLESVTETEAQQREQVPNQTNAVTTEIKYDTRYDLNIVMRGAGTPSASTITWNSKAWAVDSVQKAGTYNGLQRWTVAAHRYENYPA